MARALLKYPISGRARYAAERFDRASVNGAGGRTRLRRPEVRAICDG